MQTTIVGSVSASAAKVSMKNQLTLVAALLFAGITSAFAQGTRFGVIDAERIIQESKKGQEFLKGMEQFQAGKQAAMDAKLKAYRQLEQSALNNEAFMSDSKKAEVAGDLQRMQMEIRHLQDQAQKENNSRMNEAMAGFRRELDPLIQKVADELKLDLIINLRPGSDILFMSDRTDVTDIVLERFDQE